MNLPLAPSFVRPNPPDAQRPLGNSTAYIARLVGVLRDMADRTCFEHEGRAVSATDFLASICRFARALDARGLGPGDLVAILSTNCPDALAVRYAANLIGTAATFVSNAGSTADRAQLIDTLNPTLLVAFPETLALLPPGAAVALAGMGVTPPGGCDLKEAAFAQSGAAMASRARPDDLAVVVSSGGSTGVPKGSCRSFAAYSRMVNVPSGADRRQLVNGPLAYLSQVLVDITLLGGGTVVLRDRYEAMDTASAIERDRITDLFLVEPQLFDLMDHPCLAGTDLSSLRTLTHIGASAPPTLRQRARERFGPRIVHTYGASEEGLISVLAAAQDDLAPSQRFTCAGRLLPGIEARFSRGDGTLAGPGEVGSIEIRSPAMAHGYRNRPDLDAVAFQDGWYRSGDLGRLDSSGCLHIFGRSRDVVFIERKMLTLTMIEDTLCRMPNVRFASVVLADAKAGRRIAIVRPRVGAPVDAAACRRAVAAEHGDGVADSMQLLVQDTVPLTPQGKPDRAAILAIGNT